MLNRGTEAAIGTRATVYYSLPSTLVTPDTWTKIGTSASPTTVPVSTTSLTVLDSIPWPEEDIPGPGHYCFIATIGSNDDPDPVPNPEDLMQAPPNPPFDLDDFRNLIRRNNNVTWRNFNVVTMFAGTGAMAMAFIAPGWPKEALPMRLEVVARLPKKSRIWLEGPVEFMEAIVANRRYLEKGEEEGAVRTPINPSGVSRFEEVVFPAKLRAKMRLLVDIPGEERENTYKIFARQLYRDEEVGRVTWHLAPPDGVKPPEFTSVLGEIWKYLKFKLGWTST